MAIVSDPNFLMPSSPSLSMAQPMLKQPLFRLFDGDRHREAQHTTLGYFTTETNHHQLLCKTSQHQTWRRRTTRSRIGLCMDGLKKPTHPCPKSMGSVSASMSPQSLHPWKPCPSFMILILPQRKPSYRMSPTSSLVWPSCPYPRTTFLRGMTGVGTL